MGAREREARLSGALRDNLLKRKMQQRARAEEPERGELPECPGDAEPSSTAKPEKAPARKP
jgi:hypothetical protein